PASRAVQLHRRGTKSPRWIPYFRTTIGSSERLPSHRRLRFPQRLRRALHPHEPSQVPGLDLDPRPHPPRPRASRLRGALQLPKATPRSLKGSEVRPTLNAMNRSSGTGLMAFGIVLVVVG